MDVHEIVSKLIGPIEPVGETHTDNERFENLKNLTELVEGLLYDIDRVASNKNRAEYSMKRAGQHAEFFINEIGS